jgi:hypothetical protein
VRAWSIATINALPSEASIGTFLTFTPGIAFTKSDTLCKSYQHFS